MVLQNPDGKKKRKKVIFSFFQFSHIQLLACSSPATSHFYRSRQVGAVSCQSSSVRQHAAAQLMRDMKTW
jgi:hypothetical protein